MFCTDLMINTREISFVVQTSSGCHEVSHIMCKTLMCKKLPKVKYRHDVQIVLGYK